MMRKVYVVTAFFSNYEEMKYTDPSESFLCDTLEEAQTMKADLEQDMKYEEVYISEEEREDV